MTAGYGIAPFFLTPFFLLQNLDPHYVLYRLVVSALDYEKGPWIAGIVFILRSIITIFCTFEGDRMFAFIIVTGVFYILRIIQYYKNLLQYISQPAEALNIHRVDVAIQHYTRLALILAVRSIYMGSTALFLYSTFSLRLNFNFVTIKMRNVFELHYYVIFRYLSFVASTIIHIGMPLFEECSQSADEVRYRLAVTLPPPGLKRKWVRR